MSSIDQPADDALPITHSEGLTGADRQTDSIAPSVDDTRTVLNQADALMRRHRVFVAGADRSVPVAGTFNSSLATNDLPILTEVVESIGTDNKMSAQDFALLRERQRAAIASSVNRWVDSELPAVIQGVVANLTEKLEATLSASAKAELLERIIEELDVPRRH